MKRRSLVMPVGQWRRTELPYKQSHPHHQGAYSGSLTESLTASKSSYGVKTVLENQTLVAMAVLNCAWDQGLEVTGENDLSCYDRDALARIVNIAKPRNDPTRHRFSFFVHRLASPFSETSIGFSELDFVIKSMHGGLGEDILPC